MQGFDRLLVAMFFAIVVQAFAVSSYAQNVTSGDKVQSTTAPGTELSPEKRKLALAMLKMSEAEARTLPPDLRC